jgi:hypothetical protein
MVDDPPFRLLFQKRSRGGESTSISRGRGELYRSSARNPGQGSFTIIIIIIIIIMVRF